MYSVLIALVLVASASANCEIPENIVGFYGKINDDEPPKPCCAPNTFTYDSVVQFTYIYGEGLQEDLQLSRGAYDEIAEKAKTTTHIGISNGTELSYTTIDDYKSGESYSIYKDEEGEQCFKGKLEGKFPKICLPEEAKYVGSASLGDRVLEVDSWYFKDDSPGLDTHGVITMQKHECVPVSILARTFDPDTEVQLHSLSTSYTNFRLGICDKNEFHIPAICNQPVTDIKSEPFRKIQRMAHLPFVYIGK